MNLPLPAVNNTPKAGATAPDAANPITAGAIASSHAEVSSNTTISSLAELRKKSPELYQKMLEGIAMQICGTMQHHQDRLKELMREGRDNGG